MFRSDARIVEPGGDGMAVQNLPVLCLQQVGPVAVQHAGLAAGQGRAVLAGFDPVAGGLDADDADVVVIQERMEQAHGVGTAADAGDQTVRAAAFGFL